MELKVGSLVESTFGKDKGQWFFVKELSENSVMLVNGFNRTLKMPKTKNIKHIKLIKNYNIDFKNINDCDIIYQLRCLVKELKNNSGGLNSSVETRCH